MSNIYMDWLERHAFEGSINKPKLWVRYVNDTFVVWQFEKNYLIFS
ncbi:MAG: hypothetical protein ACTS79_04180 [Arsenophonus sp. ET-KM2-MAG3]